MSLGKRINTTRKSRKITAEKLAELCCINATYMRQIESDMKVPSLPVFIDICRALHISPDYLLQDDMEENELTEIREIEQVWKELPPEKLDIVLAMIKAALEHERK